MEQSRKKLNRLGELAFVFGTLFIAIGVALMEKGGLGMSMVTSQSYVISLGIPALSFGTADYLLQGLLLVAFFFIIGRFSWKYLLSFLSAFIFGITLDAVIWLLKGIVLTTFSMRCLFFVLGMLINALGVAVFFKTYLPLQVYELFVKGICVRFGKPLPRIKTAFDCCCCLNSILLSLLLLGELRAVGIGTVACALCNGTLIGFYTRIMDRFLDFSPMFPKLYEFFRKDGLSI